jgi:pimeloyl-ACP methyl ester carboxylesterase
VPALRDTSVTLPDDRSLAYTEWGVLDGKPVLCFHGTPGSRLWCPDEAATTAAGVRLIMPDRPGIGGSDPLEAKTIGDWPKDVVALADALDIPEFGVVGMSAGGPYAAACAALIPDRLLGVAIVASRALTEYNWSERPGVQEEWPASERAEFELVQEDAAAGAALAAQNGAELVDLLGEHPETAQSWLESETDADRWLFEDSARKADFEAAMREWRRQGPNAMKWDFIDLYQPWGFRLADIQIPVTIWCGSQDPRVRFMQFQADTIPNSSLVIWPDSGHLGMAKHWSEILEAVVGSR